jgi:hypothetical protein
LNCSSYSASSKSFITFEPSLPFIIDLDCFKFVASIEPFRFAFAKATIVIANSQDYFMELLVKIQQVIKVLLISQHIAIKLAFIIL